MENKNIKNKNKITKTINKNLLLKMGVWTLAATSTATLGLSIANRFEIQKTSSEYDNMNVALSNLAQSYSATAKATEVNSKNIASLSNVVSANVSALIESIEDSNNALTANYKADMTKQLDELQAIWDSEQEDAVQGMTQGDVDDIYNAIAPILADTISLKTQQDALRGIVQLSSDKWDASSAEYATLISELSAQITAIENSTDLLNNGENGTILDDLKSKVSEISDKILEMDTIRQKLIVLQDDNAALSAQLLSIADTVEANNQDGDYNITELRTKIEDMTVKSEALDTGLTTINSTITDSQNRIIRLEAIVAIYEGQIWDLQQAVAEGNSAEINTKYEGLRTEMNTLQAEISTLSTDTSTAFQTIEVKLTALDGAITTLTIGNEQLTADMDELYSKNAQIMNSLTELQTTTVNLEEKINSFTPTVHISTEYPMSVSGEDKINPTITIANLQKSKYISVFLKITNNSDATDIYYTEGIAMYPLDDQPFGGVAGGKDEISYRINAQIKDDSIKILGSWTRSKAYRAWEDLSFDTDSNVSIGGVIAIF